MRIPRLDYDPTSALVFYEESLSSLGALTERSWHDRLEVIAEGRAAKLWNEDEFGNRIEYVIHRQCPSAGAPGVVVSCVM